MRSAAGSRCWTRCSGASDCFRTSTSTAPAYETCSRSKRTGPLDLPEEDLVFHRIQAEVYRRLLDGENVVLSAPTSFGKSLVIDALISSGNYRNIVVVVPTIALIDETRRRLSRFSPEYKLITHVSQPLADRNLLLLTQERVLDLAELPDVDLFVIDEFYKLSPDRDGGLDRTYLLNQAFQRLYRTGAQFYFLGPNIQALKAGIPDDFLGRLIFAAPA
jgi:replicative superfamily II helicase